MIIYNKFVNKTKEELIELYNRGMNNYINVLKNSPKKEICEVGFMKIKDINPANNIPAEIFARAEKVDNIGKWCFSMIKTKDGLFLSTGLHKYLYLLKNNPEAYVLCDINKKNNGEDDCRFEEFVEFSVDKDFFDFYFNTTPYYAKEKDGKVILKINYYSFWFFAYSDISKILMYITEILKEKYDYVPEQREETTEVGKVWNKLEGI